MWTEHIGVATLSFTSHYDASTYQIGCIFKISPRAICKVLPFVWELNKDKLRKNVISRFYYGFIGSMYVLSVKPFSLFGTGREERERPIGSSSSRFINSDLNILIRTIYRMDDP